MEPPRVRISISLHAMALSPFLGLTSKLNINLRRQRAELLQEPSGHQNLIRVYPSAPTQFVSLNLHSCSPQHIYQLLYIRLWDHSLCDNLAEEIASAATGIGFGLQGFVMHLDVRLTEERVFVLGLDGDDGLTGGRGAPDFVIEKLKSERSFKADCLKGKVAESDKSCSICLEEFSGADVVVELPCSHLFHESCVIQWLQTQNSCPLCRREPYKDAVS